MAALSRGAQVVAWSYATWVLAAFITFLRLFVRWRIVKVIGKEDVFASCALVTGLMCSISMHLQVSEGGLGQHWNALDETTVMDFFKMSYFTIATYNFSLLLTKFSILFLCLRVFTSSSWHRACLIVLAFLGISTVYYIIVSFAPCVPVARYWDRTVDGWCFPNAVLWFVNAGLNIFSDFLVVMLPIPGIWKLKLKRREKIGISAVFGLGFLICIVSVIRLKSLYLGSVTTDPTFDNYGIAIWSVIEVNGAIVGACLPTLKPLITRVWPTLLSSAARPQQRTNDRERSFTNSNTHRTLGRAPLRWTLVDSPTGRRGSATEALCEEGTVMGDYDGKDCGPKTRIEERASVNAMETDDGVTVAERHSSDGWSGRSSQRPVYTARTSDVDLESPETTTSHDAQPCKIPVRWHP